MTKKQLTNKQIEAILGNDFSLSEKRGIITSGATDGFHGDLTDDQILEALADRPDDFVEAKALASTIRKGLSSNEPVNIQSYFP